MADDWVLDVLTDLRAFAAANGLPRLASQLDETRTLAAVELAARAGRSAEDGGGDAGPAGDLPGAAWARPVAFQPAGRDL